MAPSSPDLALYVGAAGNALGGGAELIPHVSVVEVSKGEAEASELWEPITQKDAAKLDGEPLKPAQNPPPGAGA